MEEKKTTKKSLTKQLTKKYFSPSIENEINSLLFYMDAHLARLSKAIKEENRNEVIFQEGKLNEIRFRLNQLEYFPANLS